MKASSTFLLLALLLVVGSPAAFAAETLLRAGFEKGFDPDAGAGKATVAGAAARVSDRFGTSLTLGPGAGSCAFPLKGNLDPARGSAILWVQPSGWKSATTPVSLVSARAGENALALWWDPKQRALSCARIGAGGKALTVSKAAYDWVESGWHHLVVTWAPGALSFYVDGEPGRPATSLSAYTKGPEGQVLLGGELPAGCSFTLRGITILAEALPAASVREKYRVAVGGRVGHERPELVVAPCAQPPAIDGKLAAGEWERAAGTAGFVEIANGTLSGAATSVLLSYDARNIYLAFRCASAEPLHGNRYARDTGSPWDEDCIEVFLQPEVGFTGKYYHAVLNAFGGLYDLEDQNAGWNGVAQWGVERGQGEWTAEMAIPHAGLGTLPPSPGTVWQANLCRSIGGSGTANRHTEWAFTGGSGYAVWQQFGKVRFEPASPVARVDALGAAPAEGANLRVALANPGKKPARVTASVLLYRKEMAEESDDRAFGPWTLAPGEVRSETLKAAAGFPVDQVRVLVRDADTDRVLLSQMVRAGSVVPVTPTAAPAPTAAGPAAPAAPRLTDEMLGKVLRERALWQDNRLGITDRVPPPWTPMVVRRAGGVGERESGRVGGRESGRVGERESGGKGDASSKAASGLKARVSHSPTPPLPGSPIPPLSLSPIRIDCWGRSYDYSGSLFPRSIRAQDAEVLAAPIALVATLAGKEVPIQAAAKQSVVPAPHQVEIDALANVRGVTARVRSHLEYDGCIKVEIALSPEKAPVLLDGLELRIPVRPDRALYYHWFEITRDPRLTNAGSLPAAGLKSHFKPQLWLGDDDRGLAWFCESPRGWAVTDKESTLRLERGKDAVVMRIRIADRPFVVAGKWQMTFGLIATPTRPMPPGWRDWLIPLNQTNPWSAWQQGFFNNVSGTDDPGTLIPKDADAMRRFVEEQHQKGGTAPFLNEREPARVIPYSQIVFYPGKYRDGMPAPEISAFGPEWSNARRDPGPRREPPEQIPLKEYYWVCPQSSYSQYYMHRLNQLIEQTGIDGIYIDGPWNTCANPLHGCGYLDDEGQWQKEYKIWPFRELLKRVYCLFHEKRKDPVIHHHTSCWLSIASLSFSHMMLDGEQYHDSGQKVEDHFMDIVPLDKWRAEHTGRQWGPAAFLLPDIPQQWCAPAAPTRELLMLTNLHDTGLFPANQNMRLTMRNYQARRLFGVAGCDFRGYWASGDWGRCDTPDVKVSVYRKPDGSRALLVVGNTAKTDAAAVVRPNLAGLKLAGGTCDAGVDLETGERIPLEAGAFSLPVKGRDFRLIGLPFYAAPPITAGDLRASAVRAFPNPGFEEGMAHWSFQNLEGNQGTVTLDKEVHFAGSASVHLRKVEGPGGVWLAADDAFAAQAGKKYRLTCQLKIANSTGAQAYWMVAPQDAEGVTVVNNNLFGGFLKADQDWKPLAFDFEAPAGTAVLKVFFLVAFPGTADVWVDDFRIEER